VANVIGSGIARLLVDIEGDPVNVTGTALDVNIPDVTGTDGSTGPAKCLSIGGTYSVNGSIQEVRVNANGELMVDITSATTGASAAGTPFKIDSETYDTGSVGIMPKVVCSTSLAALAGVGDGEITSLQVNAAGALYVEVATSTALTVDLGSNNDVTVTSGAITASHDITGMVSSSNSAVSGSSSEIITGVGATCKRIDMMASPSNTGGIWVGGSAIAINRGIKLFPGDFYSIDIDNTGDVYVIADEDGEVINYTYYT